MASKQLVEFNVDKRYSGNMDNEPIIKISCFSYVIDGLLLCVVGCATFEPVQENQLPLKIKSSTSLIMASKNDNVEVVKLLLEDNTDVNVKLERGGGDCIKT